MKQLDIEEAYNLKPMIDIEEIATAMSVPTCSWAKVALDVLIAWQLANPEQHNKMATIKAIQDTSDEELVTRLVTHLLELSICPLFYKEIDTSSLPTTKITTELYLTVNQMRQPKPWKEASNLRWVFPLLHWIYDSLDIPRARSNWTRLVQLILKLLSENEPKFRITGCTLTHKLLDVTPAELISPTESLTVLHDALSRCLSPDVMLSPTVRPAHIQTLIRLERETVQVLDAAYPAFIRFEVSTSTPDTTVKLARILRENVLPSFNVVEMHNHVAVTTCLLGHLRHVIEDLSINIVPHLAPIVKIICSIISDRRASLSPELLSAACLTLESLIKSAPHRILAWRSGLLSGIIAARSNSCNILDGPIADAYEVFFPVERVILQCEMLVTKLRHTANMFVPACGEGFERNTFDAELARLAESDDALLWLLRLL